MQETHFQRLARWLEMESQAEARRLSERHAASNNQDAENTGDTSDQKLSEKAAAAAAIAVAQAEADQQMPKS